MMQYKTKYTEFIDNVNDFKQKAKSYTLDIKYLRISH